MVALAALASWAGPLLSGIGKGKSTGPTQVSGFASLPGEVKDYMLKTLFPMIQQMGAQGYQGLPKRRVTAADMDPFSGNPTLPYLQQLSDEQAATRSPLADMAKTSGGGDMERMQAEMNWNKAHAPGMGGLRKGVSFEDFYNSISPDNRAGVFGMKR